MSMSFFMVLMLIPIKRKGNRFLLGCLLQQKRPYKTVTERP